MTDILVNRPLQWRSIRKSVGALDTLPLALPAGTDVNGMSINGTGYRWGHFRVRVVSGTYASDQVSFRPAFWDEVSSRFVYDSAVAATAFQQTSQNLPSGCAKFNLYGRRFTIAISATTDATVLFDIDGAVFGGAEGYGILD
jgi:hypothetical protein